MKKIIIFIVVGLMLSCCTHRRFMVNDIRPIMATYITNPVPNIPHFRVLTFYEDSTYSYFYSKISFRQHLNWDAHTIGTWTQHGDTIITFPRYWIFPKDVKDLEIVPVDSFRIKIDPVPGDDREPRYYLYHKDRLDDITEQVVIDTTHTYYMGIPVTPDSVIYIEDPFLTKEYLKSMLSLPPTEYKLVGSPRKDNEIIKEENFLFW